MVQDTKVKVEYPLKQGLKPIVLIPLNSNPGKVKVEYPLKQGLKLFRLILEILIVEHMLK